LNHIQVGKHYGFPPRHERWLPGVTDEPPVLALGPQHQSACGLVFNEPHGSLNPGRTQAPAIPLPSAPEQRLFGPAHWAGEVLIAGESRGRIWSGQLARTADGYVGRSRTIARLALLTLDVAISPRGALYVCCHSGPPDWGTGPQGPGRIFQIAYDRPTAPQPLAVWPEKSTEVRIRFNLPIEAPALKDLGIEFGEYVTAGDRHEVLRPPYAVVEQQAAVPRGKLPILSRRLEDNGRILVLETAPHPLPVTYVVAIGELRAAGQTHTPGDSVELEYDLTEGCRSFAIGAVQTSREGSSKLVAWAPPARASAGTSSRPAQKPEGDWENGRDLFVGKLQCAKCHRIRGEGGNAGPDLSNLIHRDPTSILRDIREPSAALHPEYVTYLAETRSGDSHAGFLRPSPDPAEVILADVEGREQRWLRKDLLRLVPTGASLMPTGLIDGLNPTQTRDLLTFLSWARPTRSRDEISRLPKVARTAADDRPIRLVLVASKQDHGPGQHDYPAWQTKWMRLLGKAARKTVVEKAWEWPTPEQWAQADAVVFYTWNHDWSAARYSALDAFQARGGGVVVLHSAVIADKDSLPLSERLGLSAHPGISYRHMPFELELSAEPSPLTRGLPLRMRFLDEPYWPLDGDTRRVHLLGWAQVDDQRRPLVWTYQRGAGRVFGSILGHYFWTLDDPYYRLLVLRGIAWAARADPDALVDLTALETATD
jgi:putative heme-binding domain-containing protein